MDKLLLGRYIPGHSWIHELDPRTKLMASFYYIGIVFSSQQLANVFNDVCGDFVHDLAVRY